MLVTIGENISSLRLTEVRTSSDINSLGLDCEVYPLAVELACRVLTELRPGSTKSTADGLFL
jgi:hypothetical protein